MKFNASQKNYEIGGVKIGGVPGLRPTVLVGSIFYRNHKIVTNEMTGEFDRDAAEKLINVQDDFSERTGNPCMLDVIGATTEALVKEVDFVSGVTDCPIFLDGVSPQVRIDSLEKLSESGLIDRIIYNSVTPEFKMNETEALKRYKVENVVLLAYNVKDFTARGRLSCVKDTIPRLQEAGVQRILVDTCVLDVPSLGSACKAIQDVKNELGFPTGCGAHNAIRTWKGLRKKMGMQALSPSSAVATTVSVAAGSDFVLYGPIRDAAFMFPAIALVDTVNARIAIEDGMKPEKTHPMYRIA